jgi:hypothetical protein
MQKHPKLSAQKQQLTDSDCEKVGEEFNIKNNVNYMSANA